MSIQLSSEVFRNRLKLKHFYLLAALKDHASLHAAATALHVSQPAATRLLQEVENLVGAPLFERTNKGLKVTDLGSILVTQASQLSVELEDVFSEIRNVRDGLTGMLSIGVISAAPPLLLSKALAIVRKEAPSLRILVTEGTQGLLLDALRDGTIDVVIGRAVDANQIEHLHTETLLHEHFSIVSRPDHPLSRLARPVMLEDTVDWPWVLPSNPTFLRHNLEVQFLLACKRTPLDYIESAAVLTNVSLLAETDSLGILPRSLSDKLCRAGLLTALIETVPGLTGPILVIRRFETLQKPQQGRLLDALARVVKSITPAAEADRTARVSAAVEMPEV